MSADLQRNNPSPPTSALSAPSSAGGAASKIGKRRSRASVKPPVRILSADKSNFRDMVQKLTGFPCRPTSAPCAADNNIHHSFLSNHLLPQFRPHHSNNYHRFSWDNHLPATYPPAQDYPLFNHTPHSQLFPDESSAAPESLPTIDTSSAYLNMASIPNRSNSTSSNESPAATHTIGSAEDFSPQQLHQHRSYADIAAGFGDASFYGPSPLAGGDSDGEIISAEDYKSTGFQSWATINSADRAHDHASRQSTDGVYDLDDHLAAVDGILHGSDNVHVDENFDRIHIIRSKAAELESLIMSNDKQFDADYDNNQNFPSFIYSNSDNFLQQLPPSWLASDLLQTPKSKIIA